MVSKIALLLANDTNFQVVGWSISCWVTETWSRHMNLQDKIFKGRKMAQEHEAGMTHEWTHG